MKKSIRYFGAALIGMVVVANASALSPYWHKAGRSNAIPAQAFKVGHSAKGEPYYACRTFIQGALVPGRITEHYSGCQASYKDTIYYTPRFSVLAMDYHHGAASAYHWHFAKDGRIPHHAFVAGYMGHHNPYYLCHGHLKGGLRNGKIVHGYSGCQVNYGERAYYLNQYSVLQLKYR